MILTIISSYYDKSPRELQFLKKRLEDFISLRSIYPDIEMIMIDDGSQDYPLHQQLDNYNLENVTIATIKKDLGFNSHGARNLAMSLSNTDWNFLIDLDYDLSKIQFEKILTYNRNNIVLLATNVFLIHKDTFWSCKGYDEEFVNLHMGDTILFDYFKQHFNVIELGSEMIKSFRRARKMILSNQIKTTKYDDPEEKYYWQPTNTFNKKQQLINFVIERYQTNNFDLKKILNFEWEINLSKTHKT